MSFQVPAREIHQKAEKAEPNPAYLAAVREMPCIICESFGLIQTSPTTAHHPIHGRFSGRKRPDETALPVCDGHHQGLYDTTKIAVHRESDRWRKMYGNDTDYVAVIQDRLEHLLPVRNEGIG